MILSALGFKRKVPGFKIVQDRDAFEGLGKRFINAQELGQLCRDHLAIRIFDTEIEIPIV
jgi:hypothetical protein